MRHKLYSVSFFIMLTPNSIQKFNNFVLIMRLNFFHYKNFSLRKAFFFNTLVYTHLSKMALLSGNINTSLKLLELFAINLIYPLLSRENVFLLLYMSLIAFPPCCFTRKHPLRFFTINFLIILICEFLAVLLLQL